jgi:pimeloyl-ACP methyl ester carboxylesterase
LVPLIGFEIWTRKRGGGLWLRAKAMFREISYEVKTNNEIVKRFDYVAEKPPVLLLYGFFASRRSLTVLERLLVNKGHQVLSFNLGGLLGTFFTRGITETAEFIDYKVKRQIERHGIQKIQIVAHSKGGLVALWWALRMGGATYCDRIITLGTPFVGSRFTYLALATPLGFFFKDVWQMRPGSSFLRSLRSSEVPDSLKVFCLYSDKDGIATGTKGLFRPFRNKSQIVGVPLTNISHFEFLYRKNVCEIISKILNDQYAQEDAASEKNAG